MTPNSTPDARLRRQMLRGLLGTAFAAGLTYLGWTRWLFPANPYANTPAGQKPRWVTLGSISDFPPGTAPTLLPNADAAHVSVQNLGSGRFLVLSAVCTHLGCSVGWDAAHRQFACPCHGGRFDGTGRVVSGPPPGPLTTLPSAVRDSELVVFV